MNGAFGMPLAFFSSAKTSLPFDAMMITNVALKSAMSEWSLKISKFPFVSFFRKIMSRLIVKNLPPYVTPARLREHFEQKGNPGGNITDVKVSQKSDGTSRRFGFVGFKSEQEADAAQRWFDHTFIDSTRISVHVSEVSLGRPFHRILWLE